MHFAPVQRCRHADAGTDLHPNTHSRPRVAPTFDFAVHTQEYTNALSVMRISVQRRVAKQAEDFLRRAEAVSAYGGSTYSTFASSTAAGVDDISLHPTIPCDLSTKPHFLFHERMRFSPRRCQGTIAPDAAQSRRWMKGDHPRRRGPPPKRARKESAAAAAAAVRRWLFRTTVCSSESDNTRAPHTLRRRKKRNLLRLET